MKPLLLLLLCWGMTAWAHDSGVDFDPQPGALVPQDLVFRQAGREVELREFMGSKPIALVFGYLSCTDLCSLVPDIAKDALDKSHRNSVRLFVSIDPRDEEAAAAERDGWQVLVGAKAAARLAEAVGFRYAPDRADYLHPAGFLVLTPDGRVSRYFPGLRYSDSAVSDALAAAEAGETPGMLDRLLLLCFHAQADSASREAVLTWLKLAFSIFCLAAGFLIWRYR